MASDEAEPATLRTPRLRLRALTHGDDAAVAAVYGDPDTMVTMPWRLLADRDTVRAWIAERLAEATSGSPGFFVVLDHAGTVVGLCGFIPRGERLEIGWAIRHERWGSGYATESAAAVLSEGAAWSVYAAIRPANVASIRVAEKIGLRFEAETEDEFGALVRYAGGAVVDVRDTGAAGDGVKLDTPAVQRAIDVAAERGGIVARVTRLVPRRLDRARERRHAPDRPRREPARKRRPVGLLPGRAVALRHVRGRRDQ